MLRVFLIFNIYLVAIKGGMQPMSTCKEANGDTWEIYESSGQWRWRHTASNGRIVGSSTEAYFNKSDCISNARRNGMTCDPR
jgi:uncharacterized protein YegP (UPF0339 family)